MDNTLSQAEIQQLRDYLAALEDLNEKASQRLTGEQWDKAFAYFNGNGEKPDFIDQIAVWEIIDPKTGKPAKTYTDKIQDEITSKGTELNLKYRETIIKALFQTIDDNEGKNVLSVEEIIKSLIESKTITEEEVKAVLPQLISIIPQQHVIPNNKLANVLTKDIIDAGTITLDVGRKKGEIITSCVLSYEGDNVKLSSRQPFTEFDRSVADAVTSLYEYGDESHIVTAATVFRAMVHATETETPSAQQIGAVTRSLDKMRFVRVQIDCSEELTKRKLSLNGEQVTGGKIDTYLLAMDKIDVLAGGKKVTAYKLIKKPIIYEYSQLTGQVSTVPATLLDIRDETGAKVANTERRIEIKSYLLRRISVMKGKYGNHQSNHINYDTLYSELAITDLSRKEQQAIRDYIGLVLDSWKRKKFIKGYSEITQGRKKTGIEIYV